MSRKIRNGSKVMNESYIETYVDFNGNVSHRKLIGIIRIKTFAALKFFFDRFLALWGLLLASPLMIIISIAIKIDSKGPVFFRQKRTGKNGKEFYICKFRTMVEKNDVHDFSKSDEHTRVGKILRKTSLDEIPQLFSILTGKMSFIGPRPWIPDYYDNMNSIQKNRYDVRPGLTGLAQVMGRNNLTIFDKIRYDLKYIEDYSLIQDIKIVFLTIKTVFIGSGADAGKNTIKTELEDLKIFNNKE